MNQLTSYASRRAFGDSRLSEAKQILADCFCTTISKIEVAPDSIDRTEATDLIINGKIRVAYRCRSTEYLNRFPNDITIRLSRNLQGQSEWTKIQAGLVRYLLYGFEDAEGLRAWRLIDLRELLKRIKDLEPLRHAPQGQELFMAVDLAPLRFNLSIRRSIVIAEG